MDECKYGGNYNLPPVRQSRRPAYSRLYDFNPDFVDIPSDDERARLRGEKDPNVLRIEIYRGFVIKKFRPFNLWRIVCKEDLSQTPSSLADSYTDLPEAKKAINLYLENLDESTTD